MWAVICPYVLQYGIPLALTVLQKTGLLTKTDACLVRTGTHVLQAVEGVKFDPSYPQEVHTNGV